MRVSRDVPVNGSRYSVNEGCCSDLLHTQRLLRSSWAAFQQPFITQQTQRQEPARYANGKHRKKEAFPFSLILWNICRDRRDNAELLLEAVSQLKNTLSWDTVRCGWDRFNMMCFWHCSALGYPRGVFGMSIRHPLCEKQPSQNLAMP